MRLNGHCYCGAVRFDVEDAFVYAFYCHCSRCRRQTGSAFSSKAGIEIEKLSILAGSEHVLKLGESANGYACVCNLCHSPLFDAVRQQKYVHVMLGTLSDAPSHEPDHHIFVASKAPWHEITDNLRQYAELP